MVFTRTVKADIRKALARLFFVFIIILATALLILNVAFAATFSIPVEINWDDQGVSAGTRPTQVILRLRRTNNNSILSTLTLTASNQDPNNPNKWVGTFSGISYNSNFTYVVSQDNFSDYIIGEPSTISVSNNASIDTYTIAASSIYQNNASTNLGRISYFLYNKNGTYYLYTREMLNATQLASFNQAISAKIGTTINVTSSNAFYGNNTYDSNITVSVRSNNVTVGINRNANISAAYYGTYSNATGSTAIFTNTLQATTCNLTIHHLNEDNTIFAADTTTSYTCGDTYTASPISNNRYIPEITIGQATGTINQDIEVTYVYHPKYHDVIYQFTGSVQPPNASTLLPATAEHEVGTTVTVAQGPTAAGYRFLGWQINGSPAGASFTMPTSDVVVTGSWEQFNGYFAPTLAKQVINPQTIYRFGDTVQFQITVTNTASFPITNVEVKENLLGATFVISPNYTVSNTGDIATIATIPANSSITLTAEYPITDDVTQTGRTNTVEITAASANNYYFLDPNQSYTASTTFNTQSWQDVPVLTGINISQATTLLYAFLLAIGAIGLAGAVVAYCGKEEDKE